MTLAARLIILVAGALLLSLVAGGVLILVGASRWVQAEVDTAARVAHELVDQRLSEAAEEAESPERLTELLRSLETGYHVHAVYRAADQAPAVRPPAARSPLSRLLGVHPIEEEIPASLAGQPPGRIVLAIDPEPEVARVWRAIEISLAAIALVSTTTLILVALGLTRSLRPLGQLAHALSRVGIGDYSPRIAAGGPRETALLGSRFNLMADQLEQMQARTRALNAQILAVQERERREIARDLHDELGPCLLAANLDVSTLVRLNRADDRRAIDDCAASLARVLVRMQALVRGMISRLHLDPDETVDLAGRVQELVAFWRERCPGIEWQVSLGETGMAPAGAVALYRVAQEALTNAVRHSGARRIAVSCAADATGVTLSVRDDGVGMAAGGREGVGIAGMRERIGALGGTLTISSDPRGGTLVAARLPRAAPAADRQEAAA